MKRTTGANREMAIVINEDDSAKDQPTDKKVKAEEEPVPSQEVLELRQKVSKLEKEKQGLIRIAGEAQARVEFLESLIDKKLAASDGDVPGVPVKRIAINRIAARQAAQNERGQQQPHALNAHPPAPAVDEQHQPVRSDELEQAAQLPLETPRESDDVQQTVDNDVATAVEMEEHDSQSLNGLSLVPNFTLPIPIEPKKEQKEIKEEESEKNHDADPIEPGDESIDQFQDQFQDDNQMYDDMDPILGEDNNDISLNMEEEDGTEQDEIEGEDLSVATAIELEKVKDDEAIVESKNIPKKRKSSIKGDSKSESATKKCRGVKRNATELECPECEFHGRSASSWAEHLRISHSSSPKQAGLALQCDCGNESFSEKHGRTCRVYNVTIVRRTIANPTTPQCILCEKNPSSIRGYTSHLHAYHNNSSLIKNNIYLKCSCGFKVFYDSVKTRSEHVKKCDSHQFTLHKLDEK